MGNTKTVSGLPISTVVIVGGGTARRLGGVSKPDIRIGGVRLIDRAIAEVHAVAPDARIAAVVPDSVALTPNIVRALEDPPLGGPLAGFAAGMSALQPPEGTLVGLLTCDAPLVPRLYPSLREAMGAHAGAYPVSDGRPQFGHGLYRSEVLTARFRAGVRDRSLRSMFCPMDIVSVADPNNWCMDVDTWEAAARLEARDDLSQ